MNLKAVALIGPTLVLATCGSVADLPPDIAAAQPQTPEARCDAALAQMPISDHPRLVAVFESTALEVAAWHESGLMPGHVFFFQAEDGIRDLTVTGVQTCALPI